MADIGDDTDYAERIAAGAEREKSAWTATLEDMEATAEGLRAEGWQVLTIGAGHTAPENPDTGPDRFGLTHVVPGEEADAFLDIFEAGSFPRYEVFRARQDGKVFLLTELLDPDSKTAVLVAGMYELRHALGCYEAAKAAGEMYTHLQRLDGTHLGSFGHEDYEKFFPPEAVVRQFADVPDHEE
jgi:hypothetical protein